MLCDVPYLLIVILFSLILDKLLSHPTVIPTSFSKALFMATSWYRNVRM